MSILTDLIHGRINLGQAIAKVAPFIAHAIDPANANTPTTPAPADGAPEQAETLQDIVNRAIHAYLTAKLGGGAVEETVETLATNLADETLVRVGNTVSAVLHGADAAKAVAAA